MSFINDHVLTYAHQVPTPNHSGEITPRFIVMHYTAGSTADSAVAALTRKGSGVSAHLTLDLDGSVIQHAPFNIKTWHAGPSQHMGYTGLNSHSIGIEIVNLGWMRKSGKYYVRDDLQIHQRNMPNMVEAENARVGSGTLYWPSYTKMQLDALEQLTADLIAEYPIMDVVSHEEIDTRGWKTDPGPAFPMNRYKKLLGGRDLDDDKYMVTASKLNVRGGPGTSFEKVGNALKKGAEVNVSGVHGDWMRISDDGWVHGAYLRRI